MADKASLPADHCGCESHPTGAVFFSSVRDGRGRYLALSGPYHSHADALAAVADDRAWAQERDVRAVWYAYGTFAAARGNTIKPVRGY